MASAKRQGTRPDSDSGRGDKAGYQDVRLEDLGQRQHAAALRHEDVKRDRTEYEREPGDCDDLDARQPAKSRAGGRSSGAERRVDRAADLARAVAGAPRLVSECHVTMWRAVIRRALRHDG